MDKLEWDKKLLDFLTDQADPLLRTEIEAWLEADEVHVKYFQNFRDQYLTTRWALRRKLMRQDHFPVLYAKLQRRSLWRRMRVAAVWTFFLGTGIVYWTNLPVHPEEASIVHQDSVKLMKSKAVLVLSDGMEIPISSKHSEFEEQDGSHVRVTGKGQIAYQEGENAHEIVYNRLIVPRGGEFVVILSDSTKVWLNAESELRYPASFRGAQREIYLKGEAYFEVRKNANTPFIVCTEVQVEVKVYGTKFMVSTYAENFVETVLVEGKVGIKSRAGKEFFLKPFERAIVDLEQEKTLIDSVDIKPYISWVYGDFIFRNETLESIMAKLSRWYDVEVFFTSNDIKKFCFTGDMKRYSDIQDFLFFFEQISKIHFEVKGKTLIVSKQG